MLNINLLRDEERRYQGQVSSRFVFRAVLGAALALAALGALRMITREVSLQRDYQEAASEWSRLKTAYGADEAAMARLNVAQGYRQELTSWSNARLDATALLGEIQGMIPDTIQLIRLSWEDEFITPPKGDAAATNRPPVSRAVRMRVAGRAVGRDAQAQVEKLISRISSYAPVAGGSNFFTRVQLRAMQAPAARDPGEPMVDSREFDLDAQGLPRAMP